MWVREYGGQGIYDTSKLGNMEVSEYPSYNKRKLGSMAVKIWISQLWNMDVSHVTSFGIWLCLFLTHWLLGPEMRPQTPAWFALFMEGKITLLRPNFIALEISAFPYPLAFGGWAPDPWRIFSYYTVLNMTFLRRNLITLTLLWLTYLFLILWILEATPPAPCIISFIHI